MVVLVDRADEEGVHPRLPVWVSDGDRDVLGWIVEWIRSRGEAPREHDVLTRFGTPRSWLRGLALRSLVRREQGRVQPTRNGARVAARGSAPREFTQAAAILAALRAHWTERHQSPVRLDVAAATTGLAPEVVRYAGLFLPLRVAIDRVSGLATAWGLDDGLLGDQPRGWASSNWEFVVPFGTAVLIERFGAGEHDFERVDIAEYQQLRSPEIGETFQADLSGVKIRGGRLQAVSLHRSGLRDAEFERVALLYSLLWECDLSRTAFLRCDAGMLQLVGCDLTAIRTEDTRWDGALLEGCSFTSTTEGLRDRVLRPARWDRVRVDGRWVDRSWLEHGDQVVVRDGSEPEARSTEAVEPFAIRYNGKDREIVFRGNVLVRLKARHLEVRLLELLLENAGRRMHVLDLSSALDGHELATESMPFQEQQDRAFRLCPAARILPKSPEVELRRSALLRRLQILQSPKERARSRRKNWSMEDEVEACRRALADPDYRPTLGRVDANDEVIVRVHGRLSSRLRGLRRKLRHEDPLVEEFLDGAITHGEVWVYDPNGAPLRSRRDR